MNLNEATILVVDDEPDLLEIFEHWLKDAGCKNILSAANGEQALALARATASIDLLVTDIHMPVMDGISLVRHVAELASVIPSVIFVSGFGDIGAREMYDLGVEAFLSKPIQRSDFLQAVETGLRERSSLWLVQMSAPPKQSMNIEALGFSATERKDYIQLGRGGFCAQYAGSLTLGKLSFHCSFPAQQPAMSGEGYVRWRSRTDETFGIEFSYLDPACRTWLLDAIATENPRCFIPGS